MKPKNTPTYQKAIEQAIRNGWKKDPKTGMLMPPKKQTKTGKQ